MATLKDTDVTADQVRQMRAWIADCSWSDLDPDEVSELQDAEVLAGIRSHYCGGIAQFIRDCD